MKRSVTSDRRIRIYNLIRTAFLNFEHPEHGYLTGLKFILKNYVTVKSTIFDSFKILNIIINYVNTDVSKMRKIKISF